MKKLILIVAIFLALAPQVKLQGSQRPLVPLTELDKAAQSGDRAEIKRLMERGDRASVQTLNVAKDTATRNLIEEESRKQVIKDIYNFVGDY